MKPTALIIGLAALSSVVQANVIEVRRNTVVEAVADQTWSLKDNRRGDNVSVTVNDGLDLPKGTRIYGEIENIEPKYKDRPGSMVIRFDRLELPNRETVRINAVPVALNAKGISRDRDGRLVSDPKKVKSESYVVGGLVGGLLLGSLLKKPFEGAFVGTLAGIVLSESERANNNPDLVAKKGTKLGALFQDDVRYEVRNGSWGNGNGRWDDRDRDRDRDRGDFGNGNGRWDDDRDRDRDRDRNWDNDTEIRFDNRVLSFGRNEQPYRQGSTLMVPVAPMGRHLGLDTEIRNDRVYIENRESSLRLFVDDKNFRFDGRSGQLNVAPTKKGNVVFVPLEVFATFSDKPITYNGRRVSKI